MEKIKKMFSSKSSRNGTYSVGLAVIVIAIAIVINLVAGQLPEKVRNIDISSNNLYDISSVSTKMLKKLDKKVDLKVIAEQDSVDTRIKTFVKKYAALSGKVKVEWVDSVLHPSVLQKYNTDGNVIVVSCDATGKSTTISFSDIIQSDYYSYYTTEVYLGENSVFTLDTAQIKGVDSTVRENNVHLEAGSKLYVIEKLMTHGKQEATSNMMVELLGEGSSAQIVSRSVAKGESRQVFHPRAVGKNRCHAHVQCDSIIMDHAEVSSIPEINAKHVDAAIIHEAAIGRINDEQLIKLRTLGMTEEEAEGVIIENFLN